MTNQEIMDYFHISRDTARRDIVRLVNENLAVRTHGGITLNDVHQIGSYQIRKQENEKLSKEISIKVNESLIEKPSNPGNTIENTTGDNTNNTVENTTTGNITDNTVGNTTTENTTGNTVKNTTIDNTSNNTTENSDKNTINDITENNSVKNELENNQQNNIINSNKNNSTDESKSTNKTEENLPKMFPKTGASRTILLVIIILAILAIILYYKNKKIGKTMIMLIICGILISQSTVFAASEIAKDDIKLSEDISKIEN